MFTVDSTRFRAALRAKGYRSVQELAGHLAIHRNSIQRYLSGRRVFPVVFEKVIDSLGLKPTEILVEKKKVPAEEFEKMALIVDQLHSDFSQVTFVLFGSRAQGRAQKYSDWDIGVYSRHGISHALYVDMRTRVDDLAENLPFFVELVNFNRADFSFLLNASRQWVFLAGWQRDWLDLQRRVTGWRVKEKNPIS